MKRLKLNFNLIVVMLMLLNLGSVAQSTTVIVREAYKSSYGTTYWIDSYPSTSITPTTKTTTTTTSGNAWMNVYAPTEVAGDKNYEVDLRRSLELFNKKNKTGDEYKEMRQLAYRWGVTYKRPKDARLRTFYRYYSDGIFPLCDIFGDEPMGLIESIEKGY